MNLEPLRALRRLGVERVRAEFSGYGDDGCLSRIVTEPERPLPRELYRFLEELFYFNLNRDISYAFSFDGYGCCGSYVLNLCDLSLDVHVVSPGLEGSDDDDDEPVEYDLLCDEKRQFDWPSRHQQLEWLDDDMNYPTA